jgi:hypothetical protein
MIYICMTHMKFSPVPKTTLKDYINEEVMAEDELNRVKRQGVPTYVFSNPLLLNGEKKSAHDLFPQVYTFTHMIYFLFILLLLLLLLLLFQVESHCELRLRKRERTVYIYIFIMLNN